MTDLSCLYIEVEAFMSVTEKSDFTCQSISMSKETRLQVIILVLMESRFSSTQTKLCHFCNPFLFPCLLGAKMLSGDKIDLSELSHLSILMSWPQTFPCVLLSSVFNFAFQAIPVLTGLRSVPSDLLS